MTILVTAARVPSEGPSPAPRVAESTPLSFSNLQKWVQTVDDLPISMVLWTAEVK